MASAKAADSAVAHPTAMRGGLARSSRGAPTRPVGALFSVWLSDRPCRGHRPLSAQRKDVGRKDVGRQPRHRLPQRSQPDILHARILSRALGIAVALGLAIVFVWIGFGPGERHFTGSGAFLGPLVGRAMFGLFGLLTFVVVCWMEVRRLKRNLAAAKDNK
jgi:hypothetical protein